MKKRIITILVVLCLAAAFMPIVTRAAITPYFMAVNDTLLPFNKETMPFVSGGEFFVPDKVFEYIEIWAVGSDSLEHVRLYKGSKYIDFYTDSRLSVDNDGNILRWPPARRIDSIFYLPLQQVCDYFGLSFYTIEVTSDIIAEQKMYVIRIVSNALINGPTFVGMNKNAIRAAYNEFYAPPEPPSPTPTGSPYIPPRPPEPPPSYHDVNIHLSFFDISAGSADGILDLLDMHAEPGFYSCFFVSGSDVSEDPGLIRRIYGSGHMVGIWLETGALSEYLETSALLFEAAKVKTVIVSAGDVAETAIATADANKLVFWESGQSMDDYDDQSMTLITESIPTESGARMNLFFPCSESAMSVLPGVYLFLRANEYTVSRITETIEPVKTMEKEEE